MLAWAPSGRPAAADVEYTTFPTTAAPAAVAATGAAQPPVRAAPPRPRERDAAAQPHPASAPARAAAARDLAGSVPDYVTGRQTVTTEDAAPQAVEVIGRGHTIAEEPPVPEDGPYRDAATEPNYALVERHQHLHPGGRHGVAAAARARPRRNGAAGLTSGRFGEDAATRPGVAVAFRPPRELAEQMGEIARAVEVTPPRSPQLARAATDAAPTVSASH